MIKDALALATRGPAAAGIVGFLERFDGRRADLLRVLTFHRVDWPAARPELNPGLISATPEAFAAQMELLAERFRVVSMAEALEACRRGTGLPPRAVLVTFDDACADFAAHAWPAMRRLGLPATLFVPTGYPDRPDRAFWWDRLYHALETGEAPRGLDTPVGRIPLKNRADRRRAYLRLSRHVKTLSSPADLVVVDQVCRDLAVPETGPAAPAVLGWDTLRRLAREGVTLAPHTRTHPLLQHLPGDVAREEIEGSFTDLEREIGDVPPVFAYPDGGYQTSTLEILTRAGCELAFTTRRGINDLGRLDHLRLYRINVGRRVTPAVLRARLLAWPRSFARRPAGGESLPSPAHGRARSPA